jgi:hypothetical protein
LTHLASLQTLNLSRCWQLSDLSPLATLTSFQMLNLSRCEQFTGDLKGNPRERNLAASGFGT